MGVATMTSAAHLSPTCMESTLPCGISLSGGPSTSLSLLAANLFGASVNSRSELHASLEAAQEESHLTFSVRSGSIHQGTISSTGVGLSEVASIGRTAREMRVLL